MGGEREKQKDSGSSQRNLTIKERGRRETESCASQTSRRLGPDIAIVSV
jgi:hypothetical protein